VISTINRQTTLIVTPPSLAGQWKEEFEKHAPSLKVLVYDGWSKVKVPITKHEVDLKRLQKVKQAKVQKKKEKQNGKAAEAVAGDAMDVDSGAIPSTSSVNDENSDSAIEWPNFVHGYDVVITTYQTLRSDLYVAHPGPNRPRRTTVVYERPRSPLVMVEWKRVVMDEVQMVGGGKAE
jgi:E3 ubiquitin-protein ligase SHPRH